MKAQTAKTCFHYGVVLLFQKLCIYSVEFLYKTDTQGLYQLPASWCPGYTRFDEDVNYRCQP